MKSVRIRILAVICGLVVVSLLSLGTVTIALNMRTTNGILEQTMQEIATSSAERVSSTLRVYKTIVANAGTDSVICDPDASPERKQEVLNNVVAEYKEFTRGNILDADGNSIFDGNNYKERAYFQNAIKGTTWISEPLLSKVTGAISIIVAAPIWQDGVPNSTVIGVVYFVPVETFLNDIVSAIRISPNAGAQIISRTGTVLAHPNMELVANYNNNQENEKTDSSYAAIAALERSAMKGETGFGSYTMLGVEKFMAYAPISDSDGWSIGVNAPTGDFMSYTNASILYTVVSLVVFLTISVILAVRTAGTIGKPLRYLSEMLSNIATTGSIVIDEEHRKKENEMLTRKDEIGAIAEATNGLLQMLERDAKALDSIANGDLTVELRPLSDEDVLGNSMLKMTSNLNKMFSEISFSSEQVSSGAHQIADGSQSLAQGSTEQSSAIDQLSGSMSVIEQKTKDNAEIAGKAAALANVIKGNAEKGSRQMDEMMSAVQDINQASQGISKVIKVIDDIAFQTNILALNAAVEAARAGQHGKGFAVVAEEVRNLAAKSAEAAKDTGSLIANSIEKAEFGSRIASETAVSLTEIVNGINESSQLVGEIARLSKEQSEGIVQVNRGIDQVAQVVQMNSATAEESAAASKEMSGQAVVLEDLVAHFKIKNDGVSRHLPENGKQKRLSMPDKVSLSDERGSGDYGKY